MSLCVVGLGELVWDMLPAGPLPGGAPANFAFHVAQLGGEGIVASAVGTDSNGTALLSWLKSVGIDCSYVQTNDRPTGTVSVSLNSTGSPNYIIHENVAWDAIYWNNSLADLAQRADCICIGSLGQRSEISRRTIQRFVRATRPSCLRILDVNLRHPHHDAPLITDTLALVNVLKLNEDEWPFLAGHLGVSDDWCTGLPELLLRSNLRMIALTLGARGSVVVDKYGLHELAGEPVKIVDTIGAGDAFTAAVAMGLLRNHPLDRIQRNAAALANFVCTQSGATPTVPKTLVQEISSPALVNTERPTAQVARFGDTLLSRSKAHQSRVTTAEI